MANQNPWLTIIGIGEDGLEGLNNTSLAAIENAKNIFGAPRHITLSQTQSRATPFPVPFSIQPILQKRFEPTVMFASNDPFWFGAGATIAKHLARNEWTCELSPSTFSRIASALGWRLEHCHCYGLHARPFETILPNLHDNARLICLMRDGQSVPQLCQWLSQRGFGRSKLGIFEALGGQNQRITHTTVQDFQRNDIAHPVAISIDTIGQGISRANGLPDEAFISDGQITKRRIRAMTLSALAPRAGETLWDLGAGNGSISIEWLLSAQDTRVKAVERRENRIENIRANGEKFGVKDRLEIIKSENLAAIDELTRSEFCAPNAIFLGGGLCMDVIDKTCAALQKNGRLVAHSVTIESEHLLVQAQQRWGGELARIEIAQPHKLGGFSAWKSNYPLTEWVVVK